MVCYLQQKEICSHRAYPSALPLMGLALGLPGSGGMWPELPGLLPRLVKKQVQLATFPPIAMGIPVRSRRVRSAGADGGLLVARGDGQRVQIFVRCGRRSSWHVAPHWVVRGGSSKHSCPPKTGRQVCSEEHIHFLSNYSPKLEH